jgi:dimethylsulfoniopropionate demethylase
MYAPLVDETGSIVNDPIIIRLAEDRLWVSIADSGVLLWLRGIAYGRGFDVKIFEPDVSPLAVQGPRSDDLMSDLLGDHVRDIKWFWFIETRLADTDVILARSGWSGQGGFEIYLQDESRGLALWDLIWEAGQKYKIRAGCPNLIDRIERGLLSYGSDMTMANNPYECGLDRFFEPSKEAECMSKDAMEKILLDGVSRNHVYLAIDGDALGSPRSTWDVLDEAGNVVGIVTSSAYSVNYQSNVSFASINAELNQQGRILRVNLGGGEFRNATVVVKRGKKLEIQ